MPKTNLTKFLTLLLIIPTIATTTCQVGYHSTGTECISNDEYCSDYNYSTNSCIECNKLYDQIEDPVQGNWCSQNLNLIWIVVGLSILLVILLACCMIFKFSVIKNCIVTILSKKKQQPSKNTDNLNESNYNQDNDADIIIHSIQNSDLENSRPSSLSIKSNEINPNSSSINSIQSNKKSPRSMNYHMKDMNINSILNFNITQNNIKNCGQKSNYTCGHINDDNGYMTQNQNDYIERTSVHKSEIKRKRLYRGKRSKQHLRNKNSFSSKHSSYLEQTQTDDQRITQKPVKKLGITQWEQIRLENGSPYISTTSRTHHKVIFIT